MTTGADILTGHAAHRPTDQAELAELVRAAHAAETPLFPVGGATSLGVGLPPKSPGWKIETRGLNRVIDYPARDMTVTVEAGVTLAELSERLAAENQRLPVDAPHAERATIGGLVASNHSGPRRYGAGAIRDYVIGISAVDGRGVAFKGGGRVVKNVAGYDFCKLLTGSYGMLAVISQVTLKVTPRPEASALVVVDCVGLDDAERLLEASITTATRPIAVELLLGDVGCGELTTPASSEDTKLVFGFEGTAAEVAWQLEQLEREQTPLGGNSRRVLRDVAAAPAWQALIEFPAVAAPLVVKASVRPSAVQRYCSELRRLAGDCVIAAHAGNGIVVARFPTFSAADAATLLVRGVHPAATACGGHAIVLHADAIAELTRAAVFGPARSDLNVLRSVKRQFDPLNLLNRGRFQFDA